LLKALETNLTHKGAREAEDTRAIQGLIHQVVSHTHNLAQCFSSLESTEEELGLLLKKLVANVRKTFHINCRLRAEPLSRAPSPDATLQLYKIAQEAITNAVKHGKAHSLTVSLGEQEQQLVLQIKNDGVPFPMEQQPSTRMGLRIMSYRANTIGGTLDIRAGANSAGTVVTCRLPLSSGQPGPNREHSCSELGSSPAEKMEFAETVNLAGSQA
jgi:signal transduction histidine kinase